VETTPKQPSSPHHHNTTSTPPTTIPSLLQQPLPLLLEINHTYTHITHQKAPGVPPAPKQQRTEAIYSDFENSELQNSEKVKTKQQPAPNDHHKGRNSVTSHHHHRSRTKHVTH
jgi:hypothetical protein